MMILLAAAIAVPVAMCLYLGALCLLVRFALRGLPPSSITGLGLPAPPHLMAVILRVAPMAACSLMAAWTTRAPCCSISNLTARRTRTGLR